ncbi:DegT/DnrJ/EryC1/StrS family aminotransferase [Verrucomicrobiales bacterium]|nr:DegT/DnrJ/EryC1/StrS family aminotransferase [Verrucomicrobiales bacterium]MDB4358899.1 DegT/DnrJ/EryC1/StrS family aminotransferase [Verrucomicrobiales bacterium]
MQFIDLKAQQERIREDIDQRIAAVLDHGQYILGPEVRELESVLSDFLGGRHVLGVSSGTDALLIALMALDIGPGDEVITIPYTWISTAEVIALLGARVVFVDIEKDSWNMDPKLLAGAITDRTKAIIPVGIYGQPANMREITKIADQSGIPVMEDSAQCFGASHHGEKSGGITKIGTTSFFPSKPLGGYGDGGAIFTDDAELAEKMRWIHIHGQSEKHTHPIVGLNGRLDSIQAAVVLAKWSIFADEIELRQKVADRYNEGLGALSPRITLPCLQPENTSVWAQYTILVDDPGALQQHLSESSIPSVSYYCKPLHLQPVFESLGYQEGSFPVTEQIGKQCISLPMSPYLSEEDQTLVISEIQKFFNRS